MRRLVRWQEGAEAPRARPIHENDIQLYKLRLLNRNLLPRTAGPVWETPAGRSCQRVILPRSRTWGKLRLWFSHGAAMVPRGLHRDRLKAQGADACRQIDAGRRALREGLQAN